MFEAILYEMTMIVAQVHESILHLNDNFELAFGDKELHFLVMFALGMALFFAVHFVFKRLAKWSITAISFIYVFTVMTVLGFAIEIGQKITGTGEMDFRDVVAGLYGRAAVFCHLYGLSGGGAADSVCSRQSSHQTRAQRGTGRKNRAKRELMFLYFARDML